MFDRPTAEGWDKRGFFKGISQLAIQRLLLRKQNLHDTNPPTIPSKEDVKLDEPEDLNARTADGTYNDLTSPEMGRMGARFGRNIPLADAYPDTARLLEPNPREVSLKLMTRGEKVEPAEFLNVLAAAWIQFQTHGWFVHENDTDLDYEVPLDDSDEWKAKYGEMRIKRTAKDDSRPDGDTSGPPTYRNAVTHWWDASMIYGNNRQQVDSLRTGSYGKLKIGDDGLLPLDKNNVDIAGFNDNWWLGLSVFHTIFVKEHNYVCDELLRRNPTWDDRKLYNVARLIIAALMARIHTIEWTPAILPNEISKRGLSLGWFFITSGNHDHDDVPFTLTEEFVSVYRMHPLMLDFYNFYSHQNGKHVVVKDLFQVTGKRAREVMNEVGVRNVLYTFGIENPGSVVLHNYPKFLQELKKDAFVLPDGTVRPAETVDLAAIDILRDRERGVLRYNDFREKIGRSRVTSFADITPNEQWQKELEEVYGDVNNVDLMAGMMAEEFPIQFGFSDTAFRVFNLMAPRRLRSDRFFTDSYKPEVYTDWGIQHVEDTSMVDIIKRHYPELSPALEGVENAFAPWKKLA